MASLGRDSLSAATGYLRGWSRRDGSKTGRGCPATTQHRTRSARKGENGRVKSNQSRPQRDGGRTATVPACRLARSEKPTQFVDQLATKAVEEIRESVKRRGTRLARSDHRERGAHAEIARSLERLHQGSSTQSPPHS